MKLLARFIPKLSTQTFILASSLLLVSLPASAADDDSSTKSESTQDGMWSANIAGTPAGFISIPIKHIISVSIHSYMMNGKIPIAELTIDTFGNNSIRMYSTLSVGADVLDLGGMAKGLANEAQKEAGTPKVSKQYPTTTHAHSVEYSVSSYNQLKAIYASINKSLSTGKGAKISIK